MAIKLASAIGSQREPIGILGGVDDIIKGTGDAISKEMADKKKRDEAEEAKREASLNEFAKNVNVAVMASPQDTERYNQNVQKSLAEMQEMYNNKTPKGEMVRRQYEILRDLKEEKDFIERDFKQLENYAKIYGNNKGYDTDLADRFLTGGQRYQTKTMSEDDDAPMEVTRETKGYFDDDWRNRKSKGTNLLSELEKMTIMVGGTVKESIAESNPGFINSVVKEHRIKNASGQNSIKYDVDEEAIAKNKEEFMAMVDAPESISGRKTYNYFRRVKMAGMKAAQDSGLPPNQWEEFAIEYAKDQASKDYDKFVDIEVKAKQRKTIKDEYNRNESGFYRGGGFADGTAIEKIDSNAPIEVQRINEQISNIDEAITGWENGEIWSFNKESGRYEPMMYGDDVAKSQSESTRAKFLEGLRIHKRQIEEAEQSGEYYRLAFRAEPTLNLFDENQKNVTGVPTAFYKDGNGNWQLQIRANREVKYNEGAKTVVKTVPMDVVVPLNKTNYTELSRQKGISDIWKGIGLPNIEDEKKSVSSQPSQPKKEEKVTIENIKKGQKLNGYIYKGGDKKDPKNWEKK
jgi:hypothetical protein